jgi:hypothetical protein
MKSGNLTAIVEREAAEVGMVERLKWFDTRGEEDGMHFVWEANSQL